MSEIRSAEIQTCIKSKLFLVWILDTPWCLKIELWVQISDTFWKKVFETWTLGSGIRQFMKSKLLGNWTEINTGLDFRLSLYFNFFSIWLTHQITRKNLIRIEVIIQLLKIGVKQALSLDSPNFIKLSLTHPPDHLPTFPLLSQNFHSKAILKIRKLKLNYIDF